MNAHAKIGCILLAAGSSSRFGGKKLHSMVQGYSLIARAMAAAPEALFYRRVLVTGDSKIAVQGAAAGFVVCKNERPELGQSHSIRLGMELLPDADGLLFLVADQPLLRAATVQGIVGLFRENPGSIVATAYAGKHGNPVLFPQNLFSELHALAGDTGGREVIRAHGELVLLYEVEDARELMDVDTVADLEGLQNPPSSCFFKQD